LISLFSKVVYRRVQSKRTKRTERESVCVIKEIFIRLFVFSCSSFELRTLLLLLVRGRLFLCGGYERRKELLFLKWLYEKCVSLKLAAARPATGSIIYLGKN
jgi:hypothetical protein